MRAVYSKCQTLCARERSTPAPTTQRRQLSPITSDLAAGHAGPKLPIITSHPAKPPDSQALPATSCSGHGAERAKPPLIHTPGNCPGPLHHQGHNHPPA